MDDQQLGALVREWRNKRDLSVRQLATLINVSHGQLSRIEAGRRRLRSDVAVDLDRILDTDGGFAAAVEQLPANGAGPTSGIAVAGVAQLPPVEELVDRVALLERITCEATAPVPENSSSPVTIVLTGPGGIGKTAVAASAAVRLRDHFDGVLWADMRAWDVSTGPRSPAVVLRSWCSLTSGVSPAEVPTELDELVGLWRSVLVNRRFIIGLDNARSDQLPALIPASPGSVVLVTSRDRVPQVPGRVRLLPVPPLEPEDAVALIAARSHQPPCRVAGLASRGAGLPLALRSLGDYVAAHGANEELIAEMSAETAPPDAVRRSTRASYEQLTEEQARAWRLCAVIPDLTPESAAAAAGLDIGEVRELLNAVADKSLLTKHGRNWIYHDIHRAFALEESRAVDSRAVRDQAAERSLIYMLHGWANAAALLAPDRQIGPPLDTPPPAVHPPVFDSYENALAWSESRWEYLPIGVRAAIDKGWVRLAWQLVACSFSYIILVKAYARAYELAQTVIEVSERSDAVEGLAWMLHIQGCIDTERGDLDRAVTALSRGLDLRRRRGDQRDIGWTAQALGRAQLFRGDSYEVVLDTLTEAVEALETIGHTSGAASARTVRGMVSLANGDLGTADADLTRAVEELPIGGDPLLHCYAYTRLGEARLHSDRPDEAEELARHAVEYAHEHSAQFSEVDALNILGQALAAQHHTDEAATTWRKALDIADSISDPTAEDIQARLDALPT